MADEFDPTADEPLPEEPPPPPEPLAPEERTEAYEQAVRDHHGYGASERRTEEERQAAADRIVTKLQGTTDEAKEIWRAQAARQRPESPGTDPKNPPRRQKKSAWD